MTKSSNAGPLFLMFALSVVGCGADADTNREQGISIGAAGMGQTTAGVGGAAGILMVGNPDEMPLPLAGVGATPHDDDDDDDECGAVEQMAETKLQPADIIWAIDNSGSMTEEALAVQQNMNDFANRLAASGIDVHLVMISTSAPENSAPSGGGGLFGGGLFGGGLFGGGLNFANECQGNNGVCIGAPFGSGTCPDDSNPPSFLHLLECVNSWNALGRIVELYPMWSDSLRPEASKHFVVVTDDDSTMGNPTADSFIASVDALNPELISEWKFHSIFCYSDCPSASATGTVYRELVDRKGGVSGDLCTQDFAPVFDELATSVIQGSTIACDWEIPAPPDGETFSPDEVNVKVTPSTSAAFDVLRLPPGQDCGAQGGWHFDDDTAPTKVVTCPTTCQSLQADPASKVSVLFGCKSKLVPLE